MRRSLRSILSLGLLADPPPAVPAPRVRENRDGMDHPSLPMTPDDAALLVSALELLDLWEGAKDIATIMRPGSPPTYYRVWASEIGRHAGAAVAAGHHTVPLPVYRLHEVDQVLTELHRRHLSWEPLGAFESTVRRFHPLSGEAVVHGWMARQRGETLLWVTHPELPRHALGPAPSA